MQNIELVCIHYLLLLFYISNTPIDCIVLNAPIYI